MVKRILIIEDKPIFEPVIRGIKIGNKVDIIVSRSADEGIVDAKLNNVDLVILNETSESERSPIVCECIKYAVACKLIVIMWPSEQRFIEFKQAGVDFILNPDDVSDELEKIVCESLKSH